MLLLYLSLVLGREPLMKNFLMSLDGNPLIADDGVGV